MSRKRGKKVRKGYLGHLIKLANKIVEREDPHIKKYTESNGVWQEFVKTKLTAINEVNNADLARGVVQ